MLVNSKLPPIKKEVASTTTPAMPIPKRSPSGTVARIKQTSKTNDEN